MNSDILVRLIDDDQDLLAAQLQSLQIAGFQTESFSDPHAGLEGITRDYPGVILSDVMMPQMDGFELFRRVREIDEDLPVILLTGHGDIAMAVEAMRAGAWDFLTKPIGRDQLAAAIRRAGQARALVLENRALREMKAQGSGKQSALLGLSNAMSRLRSAAERLGETGIDALIIGPTGVGKEALAHEIHNLGRRRNRAFIHVACDTLADSDVNGALFSNANQSKDSMPRNRLAGKIERAHRGTLYLDRVEMLPAVLQARLLHAIESQSYWVPGAVAARPLDVHVLASSSADLPQLVKDGRFNKDLYYRLSGVTLYVPPLIERRVDIAILFRAFLQAASQRYDLPLPQITAETRAKLQSYDWPGNARELRQYAESHILGLNVSTEDNDEARTDLASLMAQYEASLLRNALMMTKGNVTKAMAQLSLPRKTFYDKLTRHAIVPENFREKG